MADCKYSKRLEADSYNRHHIYCTLQDYQCGKCYLCGITNDYKHTDNYKDCQILKNKENEMAKSSKTPNKVRFEKRGKLYVELNDELGQVVIVDNPFDEIPQYVKLYKKPNGEGYYIRNGK